MAMKLAELKEFASRALSNAATETTGPTHERIVNAAGQKLYSMHAWNMRNRLAKLGTEANRDHIDLPPDFSSIEDYSMNGLTRDINFTSITEILRHRDHNIMPAGFHYFMAMHRPGQQTQFLPPGPWRLEIHPVPTTTEANVISVGYRARWWELEDADHYAAVEWYQEPLLVELIQAFAEGWAEDDQPYAVGRLEHIKGSQLFRDALKEDAAIQSDMGPVQGGAVQTARRGDTLGYLPHTAPTIT